MITPLAGAFALLEQPGGAWLFTELSEAIVLATAADLPRAEALVAEASRDGAWMVVALNYELGGVLEAAAGIPPGLLLGHVWRFAQRQWLDVPGLESFLGAGVHGLPAAEQVCGIAELAPGVSEEDYLAAVAAIQRYIGAGDCYQVNFTFPLHFTSFGHPLALYTRLRQRQPTALGGLVWTPQATILSLSPELFVERQGERLITRPMKGTAPRGRDAAEDEARRSALAASEKDQAENVMIVDLLRNDLGRLAPPGGVRVEELFRIETYPTLFQMTSTVVAEAPGATFSMALRALFPCGSITGAPKVRAMQIIQELEQEPRGLYTGSLGWIAPDGDFRLNVAIRTLELEPDGRGRMGVGSGIVSDSDPAREYRECLLKARFLTDLDPGFQLIETLLLADGAFPDELLHRERLAASARTLGFIHDGAAVQTALAQVAASQPQGRFRVRLTLDKTGQLLIRAVALVDETGPWKVWLSPCRLNSQHYLLRHKTTARALYDAELKRVMAHPLGFDALFLNERDEVCEGARSNVFVRIAGRLYTPPLSSGLLPGVLRRRLLESGAAEERVLTLADLQQAEAIYMGNALRGLVLVTLEGETA